MIWPITIWLRVSAAPVQDERLADREARRRAARPVRVGRLRGGVEVQLVVVGDQDHPDRALVLVDLVDAVHQRHLRGGDVRRAAVVGRVARVGQQREPVRPQRHRRADGDVRGLDRLGRRLVVALTLDERVVALRVAREVARVEALVPLVVRVDVPRARRGADRGVEPLRGEVGADRRRRVVDALAGVRRDLGMLRRELRRHHRRPLEREPLQLARRRRQRDDRPVDRGRLGGCRREHLGRGAAVEGVGAELPGLDLGLVAVLRRRGRARDVLPEILAVRAAGRRACARRHRDDHRCDERESEDRAAEAPPARRRPKPMHPSPPSSPRVPPVPSRAAVETMTDPRSRATRAPLRLVNGAREARSRPGAAALVPERAQRALGPLAVHERRHVLAQRRRASPASPPR